MIFSFLHKIYDNFVEEKEYNIPTVVEANLGPGLSLLSLPTQLLLLFHEVDILWTSATAVLGKRQSREGSEVMGNGKEICSQVCSFLQEVKRKAGCSPTDICFLSNCYSQGTSCQRYSIGDAVLVLNLSYCLNVAHFAKFLWDPRHCYICLTAAAHVIPIPFRCQLE